MERLFDMRLFCRYEDPDNAVAELRVELLDEEGEWGEFDLNTRSPGFLIFVYAMLACQHLYFRTNCAEQGLSLASAIGTIHVATNQDWDVQAVAILIEGKLASGRVSAGDVEYIVERMKQCPVSRNIRHIEDSQTVVRLSR